MRELPDHRFRHIQLVKLLSQKAQFCNGTRALLWLKDLRQLISNLRSKQAEPYSSDLCARIPKFQKALQILRLLHHLAGDGAVNRNILARNVLEDSIVGRGSPPKIVLGLKSIHGNHDCQVARFRPTRWKRPEGAGDQLHADAPVKQLWDQPLEFPVSHQRIASNNGEMQRPKSIDHSQNSLHQGLTLAIVQGSQGHAPAEMRGVVAITAGATQRALPRNFNGKRWALALEDPAPSPNHICRFHETSGLRSLFGVGIQTQFILHRKGSVAPK